MTNSNCSLNLWHFQRLTGTRISSVLARVREESVDAWHNFRCLVADEFPQEMLFVLFSLGVIVQYSSSSVLLGHSDLERKKRWYHYTLQQTTTTEPYSIKWGRLYQS